MALLLVVSVMAIVLPNITVMEKELRRSEARVGLDAIHLAAQKWKAVHNTYAISGIEDLGLTLPGKRYSFWYAINGIPIAIPGSSRKKTACDVTTPPTSAKAAVSADRFVAVAKGNIDIDGTCDEWTINEAGRMNNTLDDIRKGWARWWPWMHE